MEQNLDMANQLVPKMEDFESSLNFNSQSSPSKRQSCQSINQTSITPIFQCGVSYCNIEFQGKTMRNVVDKEFMKHMQTYHQDLFFSGISQNEQQAQTLVKMYLIKKCQKAYYCLQCSDPHSFRIYNMKNIRQFIEHIIDSHPQYFDQDSHVRQQQIDQGIWKQDFIGQEMVSHQNSNNRIGRQSLQKIQRNSLTQQIVQQELQNQQQQQQISQVFSHQDQSENIPELIVSLEDQEIFKKLNVNWQQNRRCSRIQMTHIQEIAKFYQSIGEELKREGLKYMTEDGTESGNLKQEFIDDEEQDLKVDIAFQQKYHFRDFNFDTLFQQRLDQDQVQLLQDFFDFILPKKEVQSLSEIRKEIKKEKKKPEMSMVREQIVAIYELLKYSILKITNQPINHLYPLSDNMKMYQKDVQYFIEQYLIDLTKNNSILKGLGSRSSINQYRNSNQNSQNQIGFNKDNSSYSLGNIILEDQQQSNQSLQLGNNQISNDIKLEEQQEQITYLQQQQQQQQQQLQQQKQQQFQQQQLLQQQRQQQILLQQQQSNKSSSSQSNQFISTQQQQGKRYIPDDITQFNIKQEDSQQMNQQRNLQNFQNQQINQNQQQISQLQLQQQQQQQQQQLQQQQQQQQLQQQLQMNSVYQNQDKQLDQQQNQDDDDDIFNNLQQDYKYQEPQIINTVNFNNEEALNYDLNSLQQNINLNNYNNQGGLNNYDQKQQ